MATGTRFPFDGPVTAEQLIDREAELAELSRRAADRVGVRLVAPRRFGKTSLAAALARTLEQTGWRTVYVDFSRVADVTDVARRVAIAYGHLDVPWVRSHLAGLLSRLGVSLTTAGPGLTLSPRPAQPQHDAAQSTLLALLDLPLELHRRDGRPTLVLLDEFQDLLVARKDLDGLLRSRIQHHGDAAAYVYAGSEPSMMRELFDRRERPLFGQALPVELGPLPVDAVIEDLSGRFAAEELDPGVALGELAAFADGHPQRTMLLAYLLADALVMGDAATPALADAVVDRALEMTHAAHEAAWQPLGASERAVLAAAADGVPPTSRALAAGHDVARTTFGAAADRLVDQGHLFRRGKVTRVVDPLLAEWLRRR